VGAVPPPIEIPPSQTGNKQLRVLLHHGQTAKSDLGQDKHPKLIDLAAVWLMEGRRGIAPNIK
jgi:hypothetical protein